MRATKLSDKLSIKYYLTTDTYPAFAFAFNVMIFVSECNHKVYISNSKIKITKYYESI